MPTATIEIEVTTFRRAGSGFCAHKPPAIQGNGANGRVTIDPNNANSILVSGPGAVDLEFVIRPVNDYVVTGALIDRDGLNGKGSAKNNFAIKDIDDNVITITNRYTKGRSAWELYIGVVKSGTNVIGLIDPEIENSDAGMTNHPKPRRRRAGKK